MATKKLKPPSATRVIVEVRGGVVQAVYADRLAHIDIIDWDDAKENEYAAKRCDKLSEEIDRGLEQVY